MRVVRWLVIILSIAVVAILAYSFTLPSSTRVERTVTIERPAATVFAQLDDFRRFQLWSPWADIAPDVTTIEFEGPRRGVGAIMRWQSESPEVGSGSQTIVESVPYERVVTALVFDEFGENGAGYDLVATGASTEVTWWLDQDHGMNPASRIIGSMLDGMVGPSYERGLDRLKTLAESLPADDFGELDVSRVTVEPAQWIVRSTAAAPTAEAISTALGAAYLEVLSAIEATASLDRDGRPIRIDRGIASGEVRFDAAIPVVGEGAPTSTTVDLREGYAGPALMARHIGPYTELQVTHDALRAYAAALGYAAAGDLWERYVGEPGAVAESELLTEVYLPVTE